MAGEQISKKLIQGPPKCSHPTWRFMLLDLRNNNSWSSTASTRANSSSPSSLCVGKLCHGNRDSSSCFLGIGTFCMGLKQYEVMFGASAPCAQGQSNMVSVLPEPGICRANESVGNQLLKKAQEAISDMKFWVFSSAGVSHFLHLPVACFLQLC